MVWGKENIFSKAVVKFCYTLFVAHLLFSQIGMSIFCLNFCILKLLCSNASTCAKLQIDCVKTTEQGEKQ